jgi:hypothetical protein
VGRVAQRLSILGVEIRPMTDQLAPDHPRHKLAFFVEANVDHTIREAVAEFVEHLGKARAWLLGAPRYVDEHEVPEDQTRGEHCADYVGGFIELYSAHAPWTVPRDLDLLQFAEATALMTAVEDCSRRLKLDFEIYYAGEVIGYVRNGQMVEGVREGFLDEWKHVLDQAPD